MRVPFLRGGGNPAVTLSDSVPAEGCIKVSTYTYCIVYGSPPLEFRIRGNRWSEPRDSKQPRSHRQCVGMHDLPLVMLVQCLRRADRGARRRAHASLSVRPLPLRVRHPPHRSRGIARSFASGGAWRRCGRRYACAVCRPPCARAWRRRLHARPLESHGPHRCWPRPLTCAHHLLSVVWRVALPRLPRPLSRPARPFSLTGVPDPSVCSVGCCAPLLAAAGPSVVAGSPASSSVSSL